MPQLGGPALHLAGGARLLVLRGLLDVQSVRARLGSISAIREALMEEASEAAGC